MNIDRIRRALIRACINWNDSTTGSALSFTHSRKDLFKILEDELGEEQADKCRLDMPNNTLTINDTIMVSADLKHPFGDE